MQPLAQRDRGGKGLGLLLLGGLALLTLARGGASKAATPSGTIQNVLVAQARMASARLLKDPTKQPVHVGMTADVTAVNSAGAHIQWPFLAEIIATRQRDGSLLDREASSAPVIVQSPGKLTRVAMFPSPVFAPLWAAMEAGELVGFSVSVFAATSDSSGNPTTTFAHLTTSVREIAVERFISPLVGKLPPCGRYGDVNGDGVITQADVDMITQHLAGVITLSPGQRQLADVDGSGVIDINDITALVNYINGDSRATLPICRMLALNTATPAGLPTFIVAGAPVVTAPASFSVSAGQEVIYSWPVFNPTPTFQEVQLLLLIRRNSVVYSAPPEVSVVPGQTRNLSTAFLVNTGGDNWLPGPNIADLLMFVRLSDPNIPGPHRYLIGRHTFTMNVT